MTDAPVIELEIERLGHRGDGVGLHGGVEFFAPFTLPGELVRGAPDQGRIETPEILRPSPNRATPPCPAFGACGGCALQHASGDWLAGWKRDQIVQAMRARGFEGLEIRDTITSPASSRRRASLSGRRTKKTAILGFHARAGAEIIPLTEACTLLRPEIIAAKDALQGLVSLLATRKGELKLAVTLTLNGLDVDVTGAAAPDGPARRGARGMTTPLLELEGVSKSFGGVRAVQDVTAQIYPGEIVGLIGPNGAGKTTLFNCVTGDFPSTEGAIRFFGEDITEFPAQERIRRGLRRTYQISLLFTGLTVLDNVYLACAGVSRSRFSFLRPGRNDALMSSAENLVRVVHLEDVKDTPVAALSYGQQRQLEIAMALAGAPRFILFDEPAAGLSPTERTELVEILLGLPGHMGFIIIEHDMDVALRVAESVTMMHNGRIFKEGKPAEIEEDPEVQALYLGGDDG